MDRRPDVNTRCQTIKPNGVSRNWGLRFFCFVLQILFHHRFLRFIEHEIRYVFRSVTVRLSRKHCGNNLSWQLAHVPDEKTTRFPDRFAHSRRKRICARLFHPHVSHRHFAVPHKMALSRTFRLNWNPSAVARNFPTAGAGLFVSSRRLANPGVSAFRRSFEGPDGSNTVARKSFRLRPFVTVAAKPRITQSRRFRLQLERVKPQNRRRRRRRHRPIWNARQINNQPSRNGLGKPNKLFPTKHASYLQNGESFPRNPSLYVKLGTYGTRRASVADTFWEMAV